MEAKPVAVTAQITLDVNGETHELNQGVYYLPYGMADRLVEGPQVERYDAENKDIDVEELPAEMSQFQEGDGDQQEFDAESWLDERTVDEVRQDVDDLEDRTKLESLIEAADRATAGEAADERLDELG